MKQKREEIFAKFKEKGYKIIAPRKWGEKVLFREVLSPGEIAWDHINPDLSVKGCFFPRTEVVMEYKNHLSRDVEVKGVESIAEPVAVIGVRPCDARSLSILDKVFSWDYMDDFYLRKRKNIIVAVRACKELGEGCYCDKVGVAMDSTDGADIMLIDAEDGSFNVDVITEKGNKLFPEEKIKRSDNRSSAGDTLDLVKIKRWLDDNFENGLWEEISMKCLSCGVCAFVCPTCHCFDIVDEASYAEGERRKNWDSCGFSNFTLHTSGHNPRPSQKERFRNRIMHKFKYYKDKFDETACVGCGRCSRACPVGMNLKSILEKIEKQ